MKANRQAATMAEASEGTAAARRLKAGAAIALIAGVTWVAGPPAAGAESGSRQKAELRFTTEKPGRSTGMKLSIDYRNPRDRDAKPPAVRRLVEKLARGARFDTGVPDLCTASDAELMAEGASACPQDSRVGTGVITFDTGFAEPARFVVVDVVFLNNTDELIFLATPRGTGSRVVSRSSLGKRTITGSVPTLPGTPPDGAAIDSAEAKLEPLERNGRSYITTPRDSPDRGRWFNRIRFTYADGVSQVTRTSNPCRR